jgi:hypothetical protein
MQLLMNGLMMTSSNKHNKCILTLCGYWGAYKDGRAHTHSHTTMNTLYFYGYRYPCSNFYFVD